MNTNPEAKTVLCFGDSNTNGQHPDGSRYSADVRWTGQLQNLLGSQFYVIEEGLGGRTTNLDHPSEEKAGRNGLPYFIACLQSHEPLDIVIIMLGTNDLKNVYQRTAAEVAEVLGQYCKVVTQYAPTAQMILVAPAHIVAVEPVEQYDNVSAHKSHELAAEIRRVATKTGADFYDAAEVVVLGKDGLHWQEESMLPFAQAMEIRVRSMT